MTGAEKAIAREAYEHGRRVAISEHQKRIASSLEGIQSTLEEMSGNVGWIHFFMMVALLLLIFEMWKQ